VRPTGIPLGVFQRNVFELRPSNDEPFLSVSANTDMLDDGLLAADPELEGGVLQYLCQPLETIVDCLLTAVVDVRC
jgi:hypothetical protein